MAFKFEQLRVFHHAIEHSEKIHQLVKVFPKEELYVLTPQIQRAVDSISLNIAEGSTGQSNKEFKKFLGYSIRSGIEVIGCLHLAFRRRLINESQFKSCYS
jgi:four helix bundle protein